MLLPGYLRNVEQTVAPSSIYQLRLVLRGISSLIWRRLLVPCSATIADLHAIFQLAFGWDDEHLNLFHIHGKDYGIAHAGLTLLSVPLIVKPLVLRVA